jgi:hypothetical protein
MQTDMINGNNLSQFKSVKGSHAYLLWSLRDIDEGEPITLQYTADDSYFPEGCGCKTCNPCNPPVAPRQPIVEANFLRNEDLEVPGKKRTRRGGRRRNAKRLRTE